MRGPCAAYNLLRTLHAFLCRFCRCSCCWSLSRRRGNCCIWFVILLVSRHPLVALLLIVMIWRRCMRLQAGYYRSVVFLNDNLWCSTITEATLANILREFLVYWTICFWFFFLYLFAELGSVVFEEILVGVTAYDQTSFQRGIPQFFFSFTYCLGEEK